MGLWYQFPDQNKRPGWLGLWESFCFTTPLAFVPFLLVNVLYPVLTSPGLSWNLPSCFRVLPVRVCCALAHTDIPWAFSNCGLQVPCAKFISKPKDSKLPLSFLRVPSLCPPGRLVQLAQHCSNERVYFRFFGLETVIFCRITLWPDSWGTKTVSVWF